MLLATPLLLLLAAFGAQPAEDLFFDGDLAAARARAEEAQLMLLIELESPDEAVTKAFDAELWGDAEAVRWVEVELIAVRVSGGEADRLAELWGVTERPAILIQEPDGLELRRISPPASPKKLVRGIRLALVNRVPLSEAIRALAAAPEDVWLRMTYGEVLVAARLYREALVEFDKVWEAGRPDASFREERLRVIVRRVSSITTFYPKARGTLVRWRKRAVQVLSAEPGTVELEDLLRAAEEFGAINARLDASEQSQEMYRKLTARTDLPAEVRQQLYDRHMFQVFYNQKQFAELLEGSGGVFPNVERALATYERFHERELRDELTEEELYNVPALRNSAIVRAARFYEALLMTGDLEQATELSDLLCERLPLSETYIAFMTAAKRSRQRDEVRRLGENGIALLTTEREVEKVRVVYDKNFKDE